MPNKIQFITKKQAKYLCDNFDNPERANLKGLFLVITGSGEKYSAIDNSTGECWLEDFDDLAVAIAWLEGAFSVYDMSGLKEGDLNYYADEMISHMNGSNEKEIKLEQSLTIIIIEGEN